VVLQVIGGLLPAAAGIALSPFPIVAVILVVSGPRARVSGPAFALGWLVGLSALTALAILLGDLLGDDDAATWASWARVLVGAVLVAWGMRTFVHRPRGDDRPPDPEWMAGLSSAGPGRAATIGIGLAALNPKNVAFALASASVIGQLDQEAASVLLEGAVFVLLASSTVLGVVALSLLGSDRVGVTLDRVRRLMVTHNDAIVAAVLVLIGVTVLGDGLAGLG
jgi:threonine/homoserine/homoserine lactone efflux protein